MALRRRRVTRSARLRWAAAFLPVGRLLLLTREGRYDGWFSPLAYVVAALVASAVAYFGASWRRRG